MINYKLGNLYMWPLNCLSKTDILYYGNRISCLEFNILRKTESNPVTREQVHPLFLCFCDYQKGLWQAWPQMTLHCHPDCNYCALFMFSSCQSVSTLFSVRHLGSNCDQIKSKTSRGHILRFILLTILSAVRGPVRLCPLCPPRPSAQPEKKARGVTHPEVSDDKGQHVAPLPIVLSSCQAPASR